MHTFAVLPGGAVGWSREVLDEHLGRHNEWRPGWQWRHPQHTPPRHQLTLSWPSRKAPLDASQARGLSLGTLSRTY